MDSTWGEHSLSHKKDRVDWDSSKGDPETTMRQLVVRSTT